MKLNTNGHAYEVRDDARLVLDLGAGSIGFDSGARMVLFPEGHGHIDTTQYYIGSTGKRQKRWATVYLSADDIATLRYAFAHLATCLPLPVAPEPVAPEPTDAQQDGA